MAINKCADGYFVVILSQQKMGFGKTIREAMINAFKP
jgi:predicted RNase H-like HicB family nuclease